MYIVYAVSDYSDFNFCEVGLILWTKHTDRQTDGDSSLQCWAFRGFAGNIIIMLFWITIATTIYMYSVCAASNTVAVDALVGWLRALLS